MKKVFSLMIVAAAVAMVSCAGRVKTAEAEVVETPAVEVVEEAAPVTEEAPVEAAVEVVETVVAE